jgi:hypothetical protein
VIASKKASNKQKIYTQIFENIKIFKKSKAIKWVAAFVLNFGVIVFRLFLFRHINKLKNCLGGIKDIRGCGCKAMLMSILR